VEIEILLQQVIVEFPSSFIKGLVLVFVVGGVVLGDLGWPME